MVSKVLKKIVINRYIKDYLAVFHIGDYKSRLYMYEIKDNKYNLLGFASETLNFNDKIAFINGLRLLIYKVEKLSKIKIEKIIVSVNSSNIELIHYKKNLIYNSNYKYKDLKKLLNFKNYEFLLSKKFTLLDVYIKSLNFDNYDYTNIKNNSFVNNVSLDFFVIGIKDSYKKSVYSIFNYLDIEVVKIIYDDIGLSYFLDEKLSGVFIYFDYNNIVVSFIQNNKAIDIKTFNYGLNKLFENIAQELNLPVNIFCNFYQKSLDSINLTNKSFVVSFLNNTYTINYEKLKGSIDNQSERFFLEIFTQANIDNTLKNNICYIGEYNNLLLFNQLFYKEIMNNDILKTQFKQESDKFNLTISKVKGISLLKYYLNNI